MLNKFVKIPGITSLWRKFPFGSVALRTEFDIWERPHYAFGIYSASLLAKQLGITSISIIEFGVAGGRGLLCMEDYAAQFEKYFEIKINVYGFDSGKGMPPPEDYRDLPFVWQEGFYAMDPEKLKAKLKRAKLILGDVCDTIPDFHAQAGVSPIGFVAFDLDYYSSTKRAFNIFKGIEQTRLPRIYCYMDDIIWPERACHNEWTGELCAIREFNQENEFLKICQIHKLKWTRYKQKAWNEQIYVLHDFKHPLYSNMITPSGEKHRQLDI